MALTNKEKDAVNTCLMAIAKEIPRNLISAHLVDSNVKYENGEQYMVVKLGDVLNEMRKMIKVLKDEG